MRTLDPPAEFDRIRDEIECQLHAVMARGAKAELLEVDDPHSLDGPRLVQAMDAVRDVRDRTMREIGAGLMNPQLLREDRRALAAAGLLGEFLSERAAPVTMASLACGAAGPAVDILADLHARGVAVEGLTMLDRDPLALAVAGEVTRQRDPRVPVRLLLNDLVDLERFEAIDLAAVLGAGSMTAVEMLGLFEYLPDELAVSLLQRVAGALEPGGLIVFANMLTPRPEQEVFEHVIQWPSLFQRRVDQVLDLVEAAGFSPAQTQFVIPEGDLVYQIVLVDTAHRHAR